MKLYVRLILSLPIVLLAQLSLAATPPTTENTHQQNDSIYLPEQVQKGQKAYGLTVFNDETVERFELELLGVAHNFIGPGQHLVVAKLTDPRLEQAGVVAGMSGSPIFVDGKLLGALGYALGTFMKDGLCGITPIQIMRHVAASKPQDPFAQNTINSRQTALAQSAYQLENLKPITTPLSVTGVHPGVWSYFEGQFAQRGLIGSPGGSVSDKAKKDAKKTLQPGDAVAVQLVRGDLSIAATGTVTSVEQDRVLAFGHPFMGLGSVAFPMARARIITIVPSLMRSFKLGEATEEVGVVTDDRNAAIAGRLGAKTETLPVSVEVDSAAEGTKSVFHYEIARDLKMTGELVHMVIANSLAKRDNAGLAGTIEIEASLELVNGKTVNVGSTLAAERDQILPVFSALTVARPFYALWQNGFAPPLVKSIQVRARLKHQIRRYHIETLSLSQSTARPGETLLVRYGLSQESGPLIFREFKWTVPDYLESGDYEIWIAAAADANQVDIQTAGTVKPQNQDDLIEAIAKMRRENHIYLMVTGKGMGLRMGESSLQHVPLSFAHQALSPEGDHRISRTAQNLYDELKTATDGYVVGSSHVTLKVKLPK